MNGKFWLAGGLMISQLEVRSPPDKMCGASYNLIQSLVK